MLPKNIPNQMDQNIRVSYAMSKRNVLSDDRADSYEEEYEEDYQPQPARKPVSSTCKKFYTPVLNLRNS